MLRSKKRVKNPLERKAVHWPSHMEIRFLLSCLKCSRFIHSTVIIFLLWRWDCVSCLCIVTSPEKILSLLGCDVSACRLSYSWTLANGDFPIAASSPQQRVFSLPTIYFLPLLKPPFNTHLSATLILSQGACCRQVQHCICYLRHHEHCGDAKAMTHVSFLTGPRNDTGILSNV